jgi:hypothetical protein
VIWLIIIWVALVCLWGASKPGISTDTVKALGRGLRRVRFTHGGHPFDRTKD